MNKKIMIVDDDPDILVSMRVLFEHEGYDVLTVDSGVDCINELEHGFKGIILIDLMMPFMDGWDTIQEIVKRGFDHDVVISIITAKGTLEHEKMKGVEPYVKDYIAKPFDLKELVDNVTHTIETEDKLI